MEKTSGIYKISNTKNDKIYIGSSYDTNRRNKEHIQRLKGNYHENRNLQELYDEHGDCFIFEIVEECPRKKLQELEQKYLDELKPELNISLSAHNNTGVIYTEEARKNMSEGRKKFFQNGGEVWNKGRIKPEREKKLISKGLKEYYKNNPHPRQGKTHTEEARQKCIAASRRRKGTHNKGPNGEVVRYNIETGKPEKIYLSCGEAAIEVQRGGTLKTTRTRIAESIKYDRTAYGYKWAYKKDLDHKKLDELLETQNGQSAAKPPEAEGSETT